MLPKIISIILVINLMNYFSDAIYISEYNETNLVHSIKTQLSELRTDQGKMINEMAKDSDIQLVRADLQFIKEELIRQKKYIEAEESNKQCRAEVEQQRKSILDREVDIISLKANNELFKTDNQTLRAELEQLKKDLLEKEANILSLNAELEKQKKSVLDRESENQVLRTQKERQGKLIDGLQKELDEQKLLSRLHNCKEAKISGTYDVILPSFSLQPFKVSCDEETQEEGWTIILRRMDGSVDFYRNWTEYKNGFGDVDGEFFMGLDKIHAMTAERRQELLVLLEDFEGDKRFEKYEEFVIGNETQQYKLHTLGDASGIAGDSFTWHNGMKFSTFDRDNDLWSGGNCAKRGTGAWWYRGCQTSQLTGKYKDNGSDKGVTWGTFRGPSYSLKKAVMMIRPRK